MYRTRLAETTNRGCHWHQKEEKSIRLLPLQKLHSCRFVVLPQGIITVIIGWCDELLNTIERSEKSFVNLVKQALDRARQNR